MTPFSSHRRSTRHHLLGSAGAALVTMLAVMPAQAQVAGTQAASPRLVVTDQLNRTAPVISNAGVTVVQTVLSAPVQESAATVSGNTISAAARGNQASDSLAPDLSAAISAVGPTSLSAGTAGLVASSDSLIASSQRNLGSDVQGLMIDAPRISLDSSDVTSSRLGVSDNILEAIGVGNDLGNSLTLSGPGSASGGIVALQKVDAASQIAGRSYGATALTARTVGASDLSLTGNLLRAIGNGNAVDNALTARAVNIAASGGDVGAATVPTSGSGDPTVTAAYAVLSNQQSDADIKARTGDIDSSPSFDVAVAGAVDKSSIANDANGAVAASYGNQSANALVLEATSIASDTSDPGTLANVTGVQRIGVSPVTAISSGGSRTHVLGDVTASALSTSRNSIRTQAIGNLASGNALTLTATRLDAPGRDVLTDGAAGLAVVSPDGIASATAPVSVLNVQDFGHGMVRALQIDSPVQLLAEGNISNSTVNSDDNIATGTATGNSATNSATLDATSLRTAANVGSLQAGDGSVTVAMGSPSSRVGALIMPQGLMTDSSLSVSGNTSTGTAIGSTAANSLTVTANDIVNAGGHDKAKAGSLGAGYGAAADFALANNQKLGEPSIEGSSTAQIAAAVYGRFGLADAGATTDHSSLTVDGNTQRANALGNTAVDRLAVSATRIAAGDDIAAGSALSSSQYGQANVSAVSDLDLEMRGNLVASSASLSNNTNQALAAVNDVDNGLTIDAVAIDSATGSDVLAGVGSLGSARIVGDHVLASTQFATGTATAVARTSLANGASSSGLDTSSFTIADNVTGADASANRAINAVSVTAGATGNADAGLANSQMSDTAVTSTAVTDAAYGVGVSPGYTVRDSSIKIGGNSTSALARGNVADNRLTLSGTANGSLQLPTAQLGRFETVASAAATLLNGQSNYGAVTASAVTTGYGVPLNLASTPFSLSSVGVANNTVSANAYGNAASNQLTVSSTGRLPTAAVVNVQANYGPVTAQVIGANYRVVSGPMTAGSMSIAGNLLTASAVGNQATNAIATPR
ncbi:hypothetical protein QH494_09950 [Sphingomonas sp. AR_OL41]|uniref:beta strand repeat-containing protein n=1 Tax=Sphingomonas sp. AR_OL41 TaxID=3042729 RepID=UPI002480F0B0|nr:hypothetical protein [Sphingomonas sp. AR_OL41]MDH7972506.1 hypothetical protein [Sphingomonas sp. AR_OL41]